MPKLALLLVAILFAAFLGASCVTTAFLAGTAPATDATMHTMADSQLGNLGKVSVAGQTYKGLETTPGLSTTSAQHVLALQSAAPNNTTNESNPLTPNKVTRIIVPISRATNASSAGAQTNKGSAVPAWLWIWGLILILVIILVFLLLRLVREGTTEPPADDARRPTTTQYPSEADKARPRQIPIEGADTKAGLSDNSRTGAKDQKITRIPVETPDESRETEEESP
jgi:flagellar biosynthesis/type III secretory pathway M-ring protein FliF/YscJ